MDPSLKILGLIVFVCALWYSQRKNIYWSADISVLKQYVKGELSFRQTIGIILIFLFFWWWFPVAIFFIVFTLITILTDLRFPYLLDPATLLWRTCLQVSLVALVIGLGMKLYKTIFKK